MRSITAYITLLTSLLLPACSTDSAGVATSEIEAFIDVEIDEVESEVRVLLLTGFGESVVLSTGDTLIAKTDTGGELTLKPTSGLDSYSADIPKDTSALTVSFTRASGDSAPNSSGTIPQPLKLEAPTAMTQASYASGEVEFRWSNPLEGAFVYFFSRTCGSVKVSTEEKSGVADTGKHLLPMSELLDAAPPASGTCVTVTVARVKDGTVDPAFDPESSAFEARRDEQFDVMIMP